MLDNFIFSQPLFRQVKDCKVVNIGMRSDHKVIISSFKLTAIKFKVNEKIVAHIEWQLIGCHKFTNELFKNSLSKSIDGGTIYYGYNKHILEAGANTTTIRNHNNKVWFHFIRD